MIKARPSGLLLYALAQRNKVPVAFQQAPDGRGGGFAVDFALARLRDGENFRETCLKRRGRNIGAAMLECLRHEHHRRVGLAVIRITID